MKSFPAHPKKLHQPRPNLPLSALLLSLVVHLLVVLLLPLLPDTPVPHPQFQPTMVRLIEKPQPAPAPTDSSQTEQIEIDPLPTPRKPSEPVNSSRKALQEQRVEQEQAPRGIDSRDEFIPAPLRPPNPDPIPQPAPPQPETSGALSGSAASSKPSATEETVQRMDRAPDQDAGDTLQPRQDSLPDVNGRPLQPTNHEDASVQVTAESLRKSPSKAQTARREAVSAAGKTPPATGLEKPEQDLSGESANLRLSRDSAPSVVSEPAPPSLTREQLFPDTGTLSRIAGLNPGTRNRIKERSEVEIGDTVWLNLEENLLVSFFRRFHDQVERVWNYPREAVEKGLEGTLQLKIIVDRKGELIDVDLPQSSGSQLLDYEAIQAVYRAAPFGPLTKHYPHETLTINAFFRYTLTGQYIFGRP